MLVPEDTIFPTVQKVDPFSTPSIRQERPYSPASLFRYAPFEFREPSRKRGITFSTRPFVLELQTIAGWRVMSAGSWGVSSTTRSLNGSGREKKGFVSCWSRKKNLVTNSWLAMMTWYDVSQRKLRQQFRTFAHFLRCITNVISCIYSALQHAMKTRLT